jgi:DNA-binding NarL/FixJ family response regulator
MHRIRTVIVDDQRLFAASMKVVLDGHGRHEIEVVGIAYDGKEALSLVQRTRPEVVLMDVRMPVLDGVEATRLIHQRHPDIKVLILTTFADDEYVYHAMNNGACGYLLKNLEPDELVASICAVHAGAYLIAPSVGKRLISQVQPDPGWGSASRELAADVDYLFSRFPSLSRREAEVLCLVTRNLDNREIAEKLGIAEQTVKNYTSRIYSKLDVGDRLHAIQLAKRTT